MTTGVNWKDLMQASGGSFEPLPVGDYEVKVIKAEAASTSTGKLMYKMTMDVVSGPHTNRKVWTNQTLSPENPNALAMFFNAMGALGLDADFFNTNPSPDAVAQALVGRYAVVSLKQREWNGSMRNEVTAIKKSNRASSMFPGVGGGTAPSFPAPTAAPAPAPAPQQPEPTIPAPTTDPATAASQPPKLPF